MKPAILNPLDEKSAGENPGRFRDRLLQAIRRQPKEELFLSGFIFFITLLLFGPAFHWMASQTLVHEQLKHAFIVLGLAGYAVLMPRRYRVPVTMAFDPTSLIQLSLAFVILGVSLWTSFTLGILAGACLALSAWILFAFGPRIRRISNILLAVFAGYVFFMVSLPGLDWPLRAIAGSNAAWILHLLGYETSLNLAQPGNPLLLLVVNGRTFEVAAECNGFGTISSTVLLALLLVSAGRWPWYKKIITLLLAVFVGSLANTLRIAAICAAAPLFPNRYHMMHEVIGLCFFWGALALVWFVLKSGGPALPQRQGDPITARTS